MKLNSTPTADGYTLMADFKHTATLVLYPYRYDVWNDIERAQKLHSELIEKLSRYERVYVGARKSELNLVAGLQNENVVVFELGQDDAWIRDSGPLFVGNGKNVRMVKNGFNAWGGLYDDWSDDCKITNALSERFHCDYYENDFILEGGNITTDGKGRAILVENCVLNTNRNDLSKPQIENLLKIGLGLKQIIWLKEGYVNDETGGHVDNVCRFLSDGSILISWTDDTDNPMYARCREIEAQLAEQIPDVTINKLITPSAQFRRQHEIVEHASALKRLSNELLTASYINYYETDKAILIPQFGVEEDSVAKKQFETLFEGKDIVPLYTREYILAGGGIHCLTLGVNFMEDKA